MPTRTYEPIANITLTTTASTMTFSSIPQSYNHLRLFFTSGQAASNASGNVVSIRLNNDTASNYARSQLRANGSTFNFSNATSATSADMNFEKFNGWFWNFSLEFPRYSVGGQKIFSGVAASAITTGTVQTNNLLWAGYYNTGSAISQITLTTAGNFMAGDTATLYGIG